MKTKNVFVSILAVALVVFVSSCSGNKKETTENDEGHGQMKHAESEATTPVEVKAFENVDVSVKVQLNGFLTDYFALNQALIEDNQEGAKAAAKKLSGTISKFDMTKLMGEQMDFYHLQVAKLNDGLKGIASSADIEEIRMDLSSVSESIYALVKAYHPNESALYVQFCPMAKNGAGATWVSNTNEVINPYMGQRMLKCGRTQETL
jgi:Protein of unknown function (DUF3347)